MKAEIAGSATRVGRPLLEVEKLLSGCQVIRGLGLQVMAREMANLYRLTALLWQLEIFVLETSASGYGDQVLLDHTLWPKCSTDPA